MKHLKLQSSYFDYCGVVESLNHKEFNFYEMVYFCYFVKSKNLPGPVKELEDLNWFPPVLRKYQTDFIGFVVARFHVYDEFVNYLQTAPLSAKTMTDLCSGSGEPAISIFRKSNCFDRLLLSDKFAQTLKSEDSRISYTPQSTDVLKMEFHQGTCYTMFNAFHHFEDKDKVEIVKKMRLSGSDAFFVEILEPTVFCLLKVLFTTTIGTLLLTPFVRPFSLKRLFFTYLLPVNIITITFDGIVSVLKSRTVKQYQKLLANTDSAIKIFALKNRLGTLVVIQIEAAK